MSAREDRSNDMPPEPSADEDLVDLTPTMRLGPDDTSAVPAVELIAGHALSMRSETSSLLQRRLRVVCILLFAMYAFALVMSLVMPSVELFGGFDDYRTHMAVVLAGVAAVLVLLYARDHYSIVFLRGVEYVLFGFLILEWIYQRYHSAVFDARAGNIVDLFVDSREAQLELILLMFIYALILPHSWSQAARVVLTMALAPFVSLVLLSEFEPELMASVGYTLNTHNMVKVVMLMGIASFLAIYGAAVLNGMRAEVHQARKFGQYQLVKRLGGGGMGDVHLAEHALLKRPCAMKLIRAEAAGDPTALARFEREVRSTAQLTHPHTIAIFDYGTADDGTFYYVMEYLPGLSLGELVAEHGPLPPARVIYLLRQAASALAEAHAAGLIHRDLKPANLVVSERGGLCDFLKVLDFGLVKVARDPEAPQITGDMVVSGTPLYMSPEQASADKSLDARTDIYALGGIAYFMLTGQPPFNGDSPMSVMIAHSRDPVVPPSQLLDGIPADLEQVVLTCLAKRPADRYPGMLELEVALAACHDASGWNAQKAALWWLERSSQPASV